MSRSRCYDPRALRVRTASTSGHNLFASRDFESFLGEISGLGIIGMPLEEVPEGSEEEILRALARWEPEPLDL
jgi:hypothetical protein